MKGEIKLSSELEKNKNELEQAVNSQISNMKDLTRIACNIDVEIEKLYKQKVSKEKIKKLLNTEQRIKTMINIKSDLLEHYYNISLVELEILSKNIYDYCCLMVNKIPEQEIIRYITEKNAQYYNQLSDKDREKMTIEFNLKFFEHLTLKYLAYMNL